MDNIFLLPETYLSLATLTALEIVLGLDNIIFISILVGKLPKENQERARKLGLMGALLSRLVLLSLVSWIANLTKPLFTAFDHEISGKSLILLLGGTFLIYKATTEIHEKLEGSPTHALPADAKDKSPAHATFGHVIGQVMLLDVVFSIDSVITAVGMASHISVMVIANVLAMLVMLGLAGHISSYVDRHPTIKMLALSFLLMIGLMLNAEGLGLHIPKGYAYFAMGFSVFVEVLNIKLRKKA